MKRVFISYSRQNLSFAERLAHDLHDAGLEVWLDVRQIKGGDPWLEAIVKGIDQAEIVIICLSATALNSEWVRHEVLMARGQHKLLIPVMVEDCFAEMSSYDETRFLLDLQIIDFEKSYELAFPRLLQALPGVQISAPDSYVDIDSAAIPNPFKGLQAFQETDAAIFFGREDLTDRLLEHLHEERRFLAVVGASGSGKSSLVRAGLIPAIRRGELPGSANWPLVIFMPGIRPTESLAKRLLPIIGGNRLLPEVMQALESGPQALHQIAEGILTEAPPSARLVLVVDQFEEVFTRASHIEAARFLDLLHCAVTTTEGRTLVILTMRADFFDRLSIYPTIAALFEQQSLVIATDMTADNLRRCIESPAIAVGLVYEHGLPDRILEDLRQQPGSLPLLEYALKQMYEKRDGRRLTFAAYEQIGGVRQALAQHAEKIYSELDPTQQDIMRRLLLRLVEVSETGEATRRKVRRYADLTFSNVPGEALGKVIDQLIGAESRLLIASRDVITSEETEPEVWLEIGHEALIREWGLFKKWIAADEESLRFGSELLKVAVGWEKSGQITEYLLTGSRLIQAELWLQTADASDLQRSFVNASIAEDARRKRVEQERQARELQMQREVAIRRQQSANRLRYLAGVMAIFLLVTIVLSVWAIGEQGKAQDSAERAENNAATADRALNMAEEHGTAVAQQVVTSEFNLHQAWSNEARRMSLLSRQEQKLGDPRQAILLALEGLVHYQDGIYHPENLQALLDAMHLPGVERLYLPHEARVDGAVWDQEESLLLTWSRDGTARVWDATTGDELLILRHDSSVSGAAWNQDETRLLTWSTDSTARVWDATTGDELQTFHHGNIVLGAAWNQAGTHILTWADDNTVRGWNVANGDEWITLSHEDRVEGAIWNQDETRLLTWSRDNTTRVWDTATGDSLSVLLHEGWVRGAAWNLDETRLLTWSDDSTARIWDATTNDELFRLYHKGSVWGATWNASGTRILTWSEDGTARVWDATSGQELLVLQHRGEVNGAVWNRDETRLLTWARDGTARVWDAVQGKEQFTLNCGNWVDGAAWDQGEYRILTWGENGSIRVWSTIYGNELFDLPQDSFVGGAVWNRNGTYLLTWAWNGTARVWTATNGELYRLSHADWVDGTAWNQDESRLLTWSRDGAAQVWDTSVLVLPSESQVEGAVWNPDGTRFLSWSKDGTAQVWDASNGEMLLTLDHDSSEIEGAAWNANGTRLLTWSVDGVVWVWDASNGERLFPVRHNGRVKDVTWNQDETRILSWTDNGTAWMWDATMGFSLRYQRGVVEATWNKERTRFVMRMDDDTVQIWDAVTGTKLFTLHHDEPVSGITWSQDDTRLLIWSVDGAAWVWDTNTGEEVLSRHQDGTLLGAVWNGDGTRLLTWSDDHTVQVWDALENRVWLPAPFENGVAGAAWNRSGTRFVVWTDDGSVEMWDATSANRLFTMRHERAVLGAAWNQDETRLLTWSKDGTARVWLADQDQLIQQALNYHLRPLSDAERAEFFLSPTETPFPVIG